jgi:hypothetical protein
MEDIKTIATVPLHAMAAAAMLLAMTPGAALQAQSFDTRQSVDQIVGSEIKEEETSAAADESRIIDAIEHTSDNIAIVRKTTALDKVDIVFLPDAAEKGLPPAIDAKAKEHKDEIAALRQELEGNAMLYHAIDSRRLMLRDVVAVEFDGKRGVVIFAAAKPAG